MSDTVENKNWKTMRKVLHPAQPVGLGMALAVPGGVMTWLMILAINSEDHWFVTFCTILMILGFFYMFALGVRHLIMPLQTLWVCPDELQLRLGPIVLRRISAGQVRSIVPEVRNVLIRSKDTDLYRLKIYPEGKWPHNRMLWVDWSVNSQQILSDTFRDRITLLF